MVNLLSLVVTGPSHSYKYKGKDTVPRGANKREDIEGTKERICIHTAHEDTTHTLLKKIQNPPN